MGGATPHEPQSKPRNEDEVEEDIISFGIPELDEDNASQDCEVTDKGEDREEEDDEEPGKKRQRIH